MCTSVPPVRKRGDIDWLVLICDDDPLLTELLEHRLGQRGYRTVVARDGGEALALLGVKSARRRDHGVDAAGA